MYTFHQLLRPQVPAKNQNVTNKENIKRQLTVTPQSQNVTNMENKKVETVKHLYLANSKQRPNNVKVKSLERQAAMQQMVSMLLLVVVGFLCCFFLILIRIEVKREEFFDHVGKGISLDINKNRLKS